MTGTPYCPVLCVSPLPPRIKYQETGDFSFLIFDMAFFIAGLRSLVYAEFIVPFSRTL